MDSFLFSIRATAPVFLLMVLGYGFRRLKLCKPLSRCFPPFCEENTGTFFSCKTMVY